MHLVKPSAKLNKNSFYRQKIESPFPSQCFILKRNCILLRANAHEQRRAINSLQGGWELVCTYDGGPSGLKIHQDWRIFIRDYKRGSGCSIWNLAIFSRFWNQRFQAG